MNFQQTRIYNRSLELVSLSQEIISGLPKGHAFLADQLRRASTSIVLNFAEGHDKGTLTEQRRYFRIARGSAQEVAAIFDVAHRLGAIAPAHYEQGADLCDHIVRMLFRFRRAA